MESQLLSLSEFLVVIAMTFHMVLCPFSKVEESFNMQAIHDILHHGFNISQYDHLEFPGVVPRTFLGPLAVALVSYPLVWLFQLLQLSKLCEQYIVRFMLGLCVCAGFLSYARAVGEKFGSKVKLWLIITSITQFHFCFYMSRTLPNVFALALVLGALAAWMRGEHRQFLWLSGAAVLVFRAEVAMLLGPLLLLALLSRCLAVTTLIFLAMPIATVLLGFSVAVDSFFWQRWLWPEGEVLWFNTVLNKSSHWGIFPFMWYFNSVLPRALSVSAVLVPVGVWLRRPVWSLLWPALLFVLLYSYLPHKELRFILYTFPIFNTAIAAAIDSLLQGWSKSTFRKLGALIGVGTLVGNLATTLLFLRCARFNYPGGHALQLLHHMEAAEDVHLHIDVYTAQTGVTRFLQIRPAWKYNKTEDLEPGGRDMMIFSHLLIGVLSEDGSEVRPYASSHQILHKEEAFERVQLLRSWPFLRVGTVPRVWVLKKRTPI